MSCLVNDCHNDVSELERTKEAELSAQNMKYVQTAFSATNIEPIKSKLNKRSYSEEEIGDNAKTCHRQELKEDILEWIDLYNDKLKVKLLREKIQKLANKLKKPGEEEKLRLKIEKYMKRVSYLSDHNDDKTEFRRQLPNDIMRRLKKMYSKSEESSLSRIESLKFYSNVKRAVMNWLVTIPIKRQEFLGKSVKKDAIFNLPSDKKSINIDRHASYVEHKNVFKSSNVNIMKTLLKDNHNKNNSLADDWANDIFNISTTAPKRYAKPTVAEVKEFISEEITYFVEKSHITMNAKRLKYLEAALVDDLIGINNIDDIVTDDISNIFRDIGKIPLYKARYITDIILNDYKDYFFGNYNNPENISPKDYLVNQNTTSIPFHNDNLVVNRLIDEIFDWMHDIQIDLTYKERFNKQLIRDLAEKIARGLTKGDSDVIDEEVNIWIQKVFKGILHKDIEKQLIDRLKNVVMYEEIEVENDPKHERLVIRRYEDIIDEWIDIALIDSRKEGLLMNLRNERIHDLAIKLYNMKVKLNRSHEMNTRILQNEVFNWMKTLPLNKQSRTVMSAAKLVESLIACDTKDMKEIETAAELEIFQLKEALLDWLKKLPLYRNKSIKNKEIMELIMTKLAEKLYKSVNYGNLDPNKEIIEYVRMLDTNQNDEFVQDTALKLKMYLQKLSIFDKILQHGHLEDQFLCANINIWLKYLPFNEQLVEKFELRKMDFVGIIKRLRYWGANDYALKEEIMVFMKSLPLTHRSEQFLTEEAMKLVQNLNMTVGDVQRKLTYKSNEIIEETVKKWCQQLPLTSEYNPRELQHLIDNIITQIIKLKVKTENNLSFDGCVRKEIIKNITKFPLEPAYYSDDKILQIANDLIEMLEVIKYKRKSNLAVYGVSLNNTKAKDIDYSKQSIKNDDIKSSLDNYAKQLVGHINEWLQNLDVSNIREQGFKEVVINDLAGDIIDRHKYLELNPRSRGTDKEELEHLKYQIFKWINKLVGEDNLVTIEHASDLMNRIQSISVPMLVKPHEKTLLSPVDSIQSSSLKDLQNPVHVNNYLDSSVTKPMEEDRSGISRGSFKEQLQKSNRLTSEGDLDLASQPKSANKSSQNEILRQVASNPDKLGNKSTNIASKDQANTLPKIYDKYQKIFTEKSNEIVNASIPNDKPLADMAKTGIYKGILNGFFALKSNPDIENDYACFEFILEDKIDELIDLLPHTSELDSIKHSWKISILINAIDMLKEMHSVTDISNFRQRLTNRLNRKALKDLEDKECFGLQQGFLVEMANDYILETKYKQDDPIKSNIYKHRLMKKLDDFANHVTKEHKLGFKYINRVALKQLAMKVLDEVPIPADDILQEEVEEILLSEEIQQWYKELPTCPYLNNMDVLLRKRLIDILAKKLNEIDKNMPQEDPSKERLMKHEMTMFLERKGRLQRDQDLNINFMVDQLNNRLKNRWVNRPTECEEFDQNKPACSTFARFENDEILAPVEAAGGSNTAHTQSLKNPNDYRSYTNIDDETTGDENYQNYSQNWIPRYAYGLNITQNPANITQIKPPKDDYYQEAKFEGNPYKGIPEYQTYHRQQASGDISHGIESNFCKGHNADMRAETPPEEDERGRKRCRCMRRRYMFYDCDGCPIFVPCRYYI